MSMSNTCTIPGHEATKANGPNHPDWLQHEFRFVTHDPESGSSYECRNCRQCGSTLALGVDFEQPQVAR